MAGRFAQNLKKLRLKHDLTQTQMAERLCVDPSRISRWENDEPPSRRVLERIQQVFQVNAYEWTNGHDTSNGEEVAAPMEPTPHSEQVQDHDPAWRSKAIDAICRMIDLLESLVRRDRGQGGG
jgi:transcriptional regulator with XRE-family HTH domain